MEETRARIMFGLRPLVRFFCAIERGQKGTKIAHSTPPSLESRVYSPLWLLFLPFVSVFESSCDSVTTASHVTLNTCS